MILLTDDVDAAVEAVVAALRRGELVALPTDTVYGIAALPGDDVAMARLFALKGRAETKPVAVLVAGIDQARAIAATPLERFAPWWPGPLTVVVRRRDGVDWQLGGDPTTVGLRCPDHELVRRVASAVGPIATTSANRSGEPALATAPEVAAAFPDLALVVDGGTLRGAASTVVDATVDPPRVLREGPIPASALGL